MRRGQVAEHGRLGIWTFPSYIEDNALVVIVTGWHARARSALLKGCGFGTPYDTSKSECSQRVSSKRIEDPFATLRTSPYPRSYFPGQPSGQGPNFRRPHFFRAAIQFSTTVIGGALTSTASRKINLLPSRETLYSVWVGVTLTGAWNKTCGVPDCHPEPALVVTAVSLPSKVK